MYFLRLLSRESSPQQLQTDCAERHQIERLKKFYFKCSLRNHLGQMVIMPSSFKRTGMLLVKKLLVLLSPAALSFKAGTLLSEVNHTFVTLVPKTTTVSCLSDNRPISCCNVIYKIISKVLANRLQQVIGELISANQSDFLQDWLICDAPFLLMS